MIMNMSHRPLLIEKKTCINGKLGKATDQVHRKSKKMSNYYKAIC